MSELRLKILPAGEKLLRNGYVFKTEDSNTPQNIRIFNFIT